MNKNDNFFSMNAISIAVIFLVTGLLTIILFAVIKPFNDWSFNANSELFGQYGDFIGGFVGTLFSLVAILLLYKTLIAQQDSISKQDSAIDQQKIAFEIELFETTFFNLLKTQQELSNGIKAYFYTLDNSFSKVTNVVQGKEFFAYSKVELFKIWKSIESENYLGKFDDSDEYIMHLNYEIDDFCDPSSPNYVHPDDAKFMKTKIENNEKLRQANKFYNISNESWTEIKLLDLDKKLEQIYGLFFQRYHYAIGHFFRHLYHIIKFAKEFSVSDDKHRNINRKYVDFIQAQMSSFELMLLFYNSISFPKLLSLLIEFNFLENLAEEDLVDSSHNCIHGIKLKKRIELLEMKK